MTSLSSTTPHIEPDLGVDIAPPSSIQTWGLNLKTNHLLDGLTPWPPNPTINGSDSPLSSLGHFADNVYKLGPLMVPEYTDQLFAFTTAAFPKALGARLKNALSRYMSGEDMGESWDTNKNVWQTDKNTRHSDSSEVGSWKNGKAKDEGWKWDLLTDP